jgi:spermidine/putrescine transport system ATP-binding protein
VTAPSPRPAVEACGLTRRFGEVTALDHVSLVIQPGEFFSLLGPSGCGKTTLLRLIAGLDAPDEGRLHIAGTDATDLPAHRRPVNTVFQSYALFPHLDVWNNVAFGLRMKKVAAPEIDRRVSQVMELVEIAPLARRRPSELSGGQKQRVALARAIVNEPQVLLLDEPLAALDLKLRKQLQIELRQLQRRLGMTFIYVTHDQEEALVLSDRIAVMRNGHIEQLGAARDLYERPRTRFVGEFLGSCSLLDATVKNAAPPHFIASTALGDLTVTGPLPSRPHITLAIRPERIQLASPDSPTQTNAIPVHIERLTYAGPETHYDLQAASLRLRVETMNSGPSGNHSPHAPGQPAVAILPPDALVVLDD